MPHALSSFGDFLRNGIQNGQHVGHGDVGHGNVADFREGILFEALCPLLTASIAAPGVFVRRDVFACDLLERFLAGFGAPLFKLFAVLGVEGIDAAGKHTPIFNRFVARLFQRFIETGAKADMTRATAVAISKNPCACIPFRDLQVEPVATSIAATLGEAVKLAHCGKPIHGRLLKQRFFSVTMPNLLSACHSTLPCPAPPGKWSEDKNVRKCRWELANLQRLGTPRKPADWNRFSCAPAPNFAKRSGAGKRPRRKIADWPRPGTCNPPRHLDCGRLGDENDWPSHGLPGWLWCRAVAGGVSSVTSKADEEHGGAGCSSLPQHAGRRGHRDRRAGVHVRGRAGSVRSPARVPRHGRCKRDHLSLLLDALSLRFHTWAPCGTPGGMRVGGWSDRVAASIDATET